MTDITPSLHSSIENDSPSQVGDFAFDPEQRKLRGLLLPFGETSRRSSTGHVATFAAEDIDLPRDPSVVTLNRAHDRHDPVGRATFLEKRTEGVYAEFQLGDTDEADDFLTKGRDALRKLSAEVRYHADGVRARLTGAALVTEGAFASAALFAIAPDEDASPQAFADALAALTPEELQEVLALIETPKTPEAEAPAEDNPTPEKEEDFMSSIVPTTGAETPAKMNDSANALFAAVANAKNDREALAPFANAAVDFAIQNVQESGPSGRTIYADVAQPAALGELWSRRPYDRRFVGLINSAPLTGKTATGWRWVQGPEVGDYAGNLAEVPSNVIDTEPVTVTAQRIAGGHKLDRIYFDFNDTSVVESYFRLQVEDYARKTDAKALAAIVAAATTTAPGTVPTGVSKGLAAVADGALGVIGSENRPSFAIVSPELYRDIILAPKDGTFEFLNASFGLEEGSALGFKIVPGNVGTGKVIVGAKEALTFFELPGSPIRVDGLDVHHGGVDVAVYGYWASIASNAAAVRSVTVA